MAADNASQSSSHHMRHASSAADLRGILGSNREWAAGMVAKDPNFFNRLVNTQAPEWLWIGCADSRVPVSGFAAPAPRGAACPSVPARLPNAHRQLLVQAHLA